jgi:YD repeat-containing protein
MCITDSTSCLSTTDALGRVATFGYDGLGRTKSRIDKQLGQKTLMTTWLWDKAPNGIGKLHKLIGPGGTKTYAYTSLGQLESLALTVVAKNETFEAKLGYDTLRPRRDDHVPHAGRGTSICCDAGVRPLRSHPQGPR